MAATSSPQFNEWLPGIEIDHVGASRTHLKAVLPEASLNPSSVEMTLLEALAVVLGPVALAYQYAPRRVVEHLMGLYGLTRHQGRHAVGKAIFRVSGGAPMVTIPAGTVIRHFIDDRAGTLEYVTTETIVILTSESMQGEAYIEATETGTAHNGLDLGSRLDPVNYMVHVESAEISEVPRTGEGPETDESFDERAMAMLSRQTTALVYVEQFDAAARTREEVGQVTVVNNWDADIPGAAVGHVTVAVTDTTGNPLPPTDLEEIEKWLQGQVLASLVVHAIDPTYTTVNLSVTVEAHPGANHAEVQAAVVAELERRLDPMKWDWWNTVTTFDIASWIDDVPGVARVVAVPSGITLGGVAPLPRPGVMTVTVNESTR